MSPSHTQDEAETDRLKECLLQAVRSTAPYEQALAEALAEYSTDCVEHTQDGGFKPRITPEQKPLVETALRATLLALLSGASTAQQAVMEYVGDRLGEPLLPRLLDCALLLADRKQVDTVVSLGLVEDAVEVCSGTDCHAAFSYIETKAQLLQQPHFYTQPGKLTVLRMLNALLRRLSAATAPVLCGRVLLFLAKFFPISERSGVNLSGAHNSANATPVEDVPQGATDSNGQPIDATFYKLFWGMQAVFASPASFLQVDVWRQTASDMRAVVAQFRRQPASTAGVGSLEAAGEGSNPNPKYLSSPQLMRLQLRDAELRQHWLIQCLILLHYAAHPPKDKRDALKPRQLQELQELQSLIYDALRESGSNGGPLAELAATILRREAHWVQWKASSCPHFERPPASQPRLQGPPTKRQRIGAPPASGVRVGTAELDELWNVTDDNMSCLGAEDRDHLPIVDEFLAPVAADMAARHERKMAGGKESDGGDDEAGVKNDPVYCWKAYRLLARHDILQFASTTIAADGLEHAVKTVAPHLLPPRYPIAQPKPSTTSAAGRSMPALPSTTTSTPPRKPPPSRTPAAGKAANGDADASKSKPAAS